MLAAESLGGGDGYVVKVTPVVLHPGTCPGSGAAAPFALTDVMFTGKGFELITVK